VAAPKAPLLDAAGKAGKQVTLEESIFGAEVKPHLVHEAVRAELNAARAGTRAAKSRGLVAGGRAKPWRQKGTGRARHGTTRAAQWTGGGLAFPPQPRSYDLKVNRKARKGALRSALSYHAGRGTVAVLDDNAFAEPSTKTAAAFLSAWGQEPPLLVVAQSEEHGLAKSFRNLARTVVVEPSELEVGALVWARSVLMSRGAVERVEAISL
jgi:large subunit ribosomal protein L4